MATGPLDVRKPAAGRGRGSRLIVLVAIAVAGLFALEAIRRRPSTSGAPAGQARTMASPTERERAIAAVLDDWHDAAARADEERYFGHMAEECVFIGTDAAERWDKKAFRDYAHPHFAKGKAWSFRARRRAIVLAPSGDLAWFDEDLETARLGPARGSGVVVFTGGAFRIAHYVLSIPIPNERFEAVRDLIAGSPPPPR